MQETKPPWYTTDCGMCGCCTTCWSLRDCCCSYSLCTTLGERAWNRSSSSSNDRSPEPSDEKISHRRGAKGLLSNSGRSHTFAFVTFWAFVALCACELRVESAASSVLVST